MYERGGKDDTYCLMKLAQLDFWAGGTAYSSFIHIGDIVSDDAMVRRYREGRDKTMS